MAIKSELLNACWPIAWRNKRGTGYLVASDLIVTCWHVLPDDARLGEKFKIEKAVVEDRGADGIQRVGVRSGEAEVIRLDQDSDIAVLRLTPPTDISPLQLANKSEWSLGSKWFGAGYPIEARVFPCVPFHGELVGLGIDQLGKPSVMLFSSEAAAGEGTGLKGFSGSPVVVDGLVVGHVKRIVESRDQSEQPIFGSLFAVPIENVRRTLGSDFTVPSTSTSSASGLTAKGSAADQLFSANNQARSIDFFQVLWGGGVEHELVSVHAAEGLLKKGSPDLALKILDPNGGIRVQLLRVRSMIESGRCAEVAATLKEIAWKQPSVYWGVVRALPLDRLALGILTLIVAAAGALWFAAWDRMDWWRWLGLAQMVALLVAGLVITAFLRLRQSALLRLKVPCAGAKLLAGGLMASLWVAFIFLEFVFPPYRVYVVAGPLTAKEKITISVNGEIFTWDSGDAKVVAIGCIGEVRIPASAKKYFSETIKTEFPEPNQPEVPSKAVAEGFLKELEKKIKADCLSPKPLYRSDSMLVVGEESVLITPDPKSNAYLFKNKDP